MAAGPAATIITFVAVVERRRGEPVAREGRHRGEPMATSSQATVSPLRTAWLRIELDATVVS
jgi:hypothetical protein